MMTDPSMAVTVVEPSADSVREAKVETVSVLLPIADIVLVIDKDHDMQLDGEPVDEVLFDKTDE